LKHKHFPLFKHYCIQINSNDGSINRTNQVKVTFFIKKKKMSEKETKMRVFKFRVFSGCNGVDHRISNKMKELGINHAKVESQIAKKDGKVQRI
jgi:hypothetical protein